MDDKNCTMLFEYLRSILYDTKVQTLNPAELDEPYQKLGKGLQFLERAVREMKEYSAALSKGNLSVEAPARDNFLCENLKNIHANLNHLSWQAKQVAKGDYSQTVSYLGEFSEAFNTMTEQLRERELSLKEEAEHEKTHANMVESYNQLLMQLIDRSEEDILVTSIDQQKILYCNQQNHLDFMSREIYSLCRQHLANKLSSEGWSENTYEWIWETEDSDHRFYRVTTGLMEWQGEQAYAHTILDLTEERQKEARLAIEANQDALTGIGNRHFFLEQSELLLRGDDDLIFCYCDLDHLKYINDKFGHMEGDWYIRYFVSTVSRFIRKEDLFARVGGDEFCIVFKNCPPDMAMQKLTKMQNRFSSESTKAYPKSFSFGIVELPHDHTDASISDIIKKADDVMYQQKEQHKYLYLQQIK